MNDQQILFGFIIDETMIKIKAIHSTVTTFQF